LELKPDDILHHGSVCLSQPWYLILQTGLPVPKLCKKLHARKLIFLLFITILLLQGKTKFEKGQICNSRKQKFAVRVWYMF